ncbi:MAG: YkgJ family cysteine cluster protein [Promethearchaeota archaeon]|jgi:Fe-S-cluster containining protein
MRNKCENCGACCIKTEMILSQQDIDVIVQRFPKRLKTKNFVFKNKDGFYQLKNSSTHCVFLDFLSKRCQIYDFRPQGCRFYPLIYNFHEGRCIFDDDCPRTNLFYQDKETLNDTCNQIKIFIKEQLNLSF